MGPVAWDPSLLQPLFRDVLPAVEKASLERQKALAAEVGPELVRLVERDGPWPVAATATIVSQGPVVVCNALNAAGVGAEHAPTIALVGALSAIFVHSRMVTAELERQVALLRAPQPQPETPQPA